MTTEPYTDQFFLVWTDNNGPAFRKLHATEDEQAHTEAFTFLREVDDPDVSAVLCQLAGNGTTWAENLNQSDWEDDEPYDGDIPRTEDGYADWEAVAAMLSRELGIEASFESTGGGCYAIEVNLDPSKNRATEHYYYLMMTDYDVLTTHDDPRLSQSWNVGLYCSAHSEALKLDLPDDSPFQQVSEDCEIVWGGDDDTSMATLVRLIAFMVERANATITAHPGIGFENES